MSTRRVTLPILAAGAALSLSTVAAAGPPPPPSEGMDSGPPPSGPPPSGPPPSSAGVRPSPPPPPTRGAGSPTPSDPFIDQRTPTEDLSRTWDYSGGGAVEPNYVRPSGGGEFDLQINPIGFYQGVTLDGDNLPPFAPGQLGGPAVMTWTGFEGERGGSGSRVFLQLSAPVDQHLVQQPDLVTLRLPNTSVNVHNNMRRLDTSFFKTPVAEVILSRDGADTVVQIRLRRPSTPSVGLRDGANGYKLLVVEFPPTSEVAPPPEGEPPAPQS